jgi:hypothetical protein
MHHYKDQLINITQGNNNYFNFKIIGKHQRTLQNAEFAGGA